MFTEVRLELPSDGGYERVFAPITVLDRKLYSFQFLLFYLDFDICVGFLD